MEKELWDGDSIMADRGFTIQNGLDPLNVRLNIPSFLGGRSQLTADEVKESQTIASVRIHVERAIQRVKKFRIIHIIKIEKLTRGHSGNQHWFNFRKAVITGSKGHEVMTKVKKVQKSTGGYIDMYWRWRNLRMRLV